MPPRLRRYDFPVPLAAAPVSTLRGASVEVDARRAGRIVVAVCLLALAVSAALLFAAGVSKNAQIADLRHHGVPIEATVTTCLGLLGGSGSNPVGYSCTGRYTYAGHRHIAAIPGGSLHASGSTVRVVVASDDPQLLSTPRLLAGEHTSAGVYLVPAILTGLLVLGLGAVAWRLRRRAPITSADASMVVSDATPQIPIMPAAP